MSDTTAQPALTLVTLGGAFGLRNVSPFCLKLEMLLTALELPFNLEEETDPRKAPKGKLPFLKVDGQLIADSELIVEYLDELTQGRVYAGLSPAQIAKGRALSRLADDHLYWMVVASRWLDDEWWPNIVDGFFHIAPKLVRPLVSNMARKQVSKTYDLHGLGRHTFAEQQGFAHRDLQAIQDSINDEGFLCADTPCVFDFAVAGLLAGIYDQKPPTWITELANEYPALREYTERVQEHVGVFGRK